MQGTHKVNPLAAVMVFLALVGHAQNNPGELNLDQYYRFPLSVGAEYRSLQAFSGFASGFVVRELATELRYPIPSLPTLQPLLRAGNSAYLEAGSAGGGIWDHSDWFGALGLSWSARFSRNFELGVDLAGGVAQSYYENLDPDATTGSPGWFADGSARIGLVPSYNFAVDIRPVARYARTLGPLTEFDGAFFGLGFSVSYRFGEDPDAPASVIRALRLASGKLPAVFAAMQSYYASNPLGTVELHNEEKNRLDAVEVSFFQSGYMDAPTPVASIDSIPAQGSVQVGLTAAFNQEVFKIEGTTPLAGELIVKYRSRGRAAEQRFPLSYELMDRTAIVWDDDRKVGAFITPADSALRNYASYVRQNLKEDSLAQLNPALQNAAQVYTALADFGLVYQADPSSPFIKAQTGQSLVDSVSIGRATLSRGSGDCDDLTVLFSSLLETLGTETGFITVPGHIYPAINSGLSPREYKELHPDRGMTIVVADKVWIPVEITLVGKQGFMDAWRRGAELWALYAADPAKRAFYATATAQSVYRPVGLRESDLGLLYNPKERLITAYRGELARLADSALADLAEAARKSGDKRDFNALGISYVRYGRTKEAETAFLRALKIDPAYTVAQVNLGNLAFLQRDYRKALASFQSASTALVSQGKGTSLTAQKVLVNLSKTHTALANFADARGAFEKAAAINPESVRDFAYLSQVGAANVGRGAEQAETVLFLNEE